MQPPLTSEEQWLNVLHDIPRWTPFAMPAVVLVPHPDDETLGAGGLIASLRRDGTPVTIIAVTDGEAAYEGDSELGKVRRAEQVAALQELGVDQDSIIRLSLPDSAVDGRENTIADAVRPSLRPDMTIVAPWSRDPHPDHEATGRAGEILVKESGAQLVSYLFWTWHWRNPDVLRGASLRRFELDNELQSKRAAALAHHRSQLSGDGIEPVLPEVLLAPARRKFETFIVCD